jgi:hypothetical protein
MVPVIKQLSIRFVEIEKVSVYIKWKDGQEFVIKPVSKETSPLDVPGIDLGLKRAEIIQFIREGRRYSQ